jgi:hypothetical protein
VGDGHAGRDLNGFGVLGSAGAGTVAMTVHDWLLCVRSFRL